MKSDPLPADAISHLVSLRHAAGLSQVDWARILGVHRITVACWESKSPNHRPPSRQAYVAAQLAGLWLAAASSYLAGTWRCTCPGDSPHVAGCPAGLLERGMVHLAPGEPPSRLVEVLEQLPLLKERNR